MKQIVFLFFAVICLSSCGVKPKDVEPPSGAENSEFPRTYPDPSTDPR